MPDHSGIRITESYVSQLITLGREAVQRLVRAPLHSKKAEARQRVARHSLIVFTIAASIIFGLMLLVDATAIGLMPPRRTASLWPVRILTDFSDAAFVLCVLAACLLVTLFLVPTLRGVSRAVLAALGTRFQFLFLSVALTDIVVEILKPLVGRGRPFVGDIGVMNFSPFEGTEAFKSLPSSHASTAWALALAVSFLWPRLTPAMGVYALIMSACRVVLLAHHPSDVVAGALVAVVCTLFVRYWFAARRLSFTILSDGSIIPLAGPSWSTLKGVARKAVAP
jgi:membrane-associated phospholipid phosphatase